MTQLIFYFHKSLGLHVQNVSTDCFKMTQSKWLDWNDLIEMTQSKWLDWNDSIKMIQNDSK